MRKLALYGGILPGLTVGAIYLTTRTLLTWVPVVGVVFTAVAAGAWSRASMRGVFLYSLGLLVWSVVVLVLLTSLI